MQQSYNCVGIGTFPIGLHKLSPFIINSNKGCKLYPEKRGHKIFCITTYSYIFCINQFIFFSKRFYVSNRIITYPNKKGIFKLIHFLFKLMCRKLAVSAIGAE